MKRYRPWMILLLLAMVAGGGWIWLQTKPRAVEMATAVQGPAVEIVYATGFVEPRHIANVAARVTAPVREVLVAEGQRVARGQPLVLLDDGEQRMLAAQANAQASRTSLDTARTLALYSQGWVTRAARDQAIADRAAADAAAAAARARLDQMVIRAGLGGIILKRDVEPGDLALPNATLMQIGDARDIWVTATVDERDIVRLHPGQRALFKSDAWPGRVLYGQLVEVTPGGDPAQRAFRARIVPEASAGLPVGLSLEVNIVTRERYGVLVPSAAVRGGAVWTIADGRARRVPVQTGIVGAQRTEIRSGIGTGARLIAAAPADLKAGDRVRPVR